MCGIIVIAFHCDPQNVLFAIGSAFLYYVNHFKLYSSFCASHSKAQKVLHPSEYSAPALPTIPQTNQIRKVWKFIYIHQQGDSGEQN